MRHFRCVHALQGATVMIHWWADLWTTGSWSNSGSVWNRYFPFLFCYLAICNRICRKKTSQFPCKVGYTINFQTALGHVFPAKKTGEAAIASMEEEMKTKSLGAWGLGMPWISIISSMERLAKYIYRYIHTCHTLPYHTLPYIAIHYIPYLTLPYLTLPYTTLHYIALHSIPQIRHIILPS